MPDLQSQEELEQQKKPAFDLNKLSKDDKEHYEFTVKRIQQLQEARNNDQYGTNIESVWTEADREYVPHRLKTKGRKVIATDETLGWRGTLQKIGDPDWQSDISQPNPYIKIQTALSILVDQNPSGVFTPASKKFDKTNELMRQLYQRSWEYAKSKQQLKLFVFNLAKYGWAIARTYPLYVSRKVRNLTEYNPEDPTKNTYEKKEVVEYNDIFRENLDPWNCWIDDMARPNNQFSMRDWCWRKVYSMDSAKDEFEKYPNWKFVKEGGVITEKIAGTRARPEKKWKESHLVEILFYENVLKDLFVVVANGVPLIIEPLPISDSQGRKKLSCWQTYWTLRHSECPYGIGVYETMRYDTAMLDRVRNMTIDQLMLSIYKMFFYQGTQSLTETGDISIIPGTGKQILDPKSINWMEVPGPGPDAPNYIEMFKKDIQDSTGISETLEGKITGKTAFEVAQAKEAALKRLRIPLDSILDALQTEGYLTVSLINLLYSIPETYEIADSGRIEDYLNEIKGDPELFDRTEEGKFIAKVYREFPLNLDTDEKNNLIQTNDTRFFRIKPSGLDWEGQISIKPQSILTPSKQIDKALSLEMWNIILPLIANDPRIYIKAAKDIIKQYDKDPRDVLPDSWLQADQQTEQQTQQAKQQQIQQKLIIPAQGNQARIAGGIATPPEVPKASERLVTNPNLPANPRSLGGKIISRITRPFKKV